MEQFALILIIMALHSDCTFFVCCAHSTHPYPGESIATYLIVLVCALSIVGDVQANILAVADVAEFDVGIRVDSIHANSSANCKPAAIVDDGSVSVRSEKRKKKKKHRNTEER